MKFKINLEIFNKFNKLQIGIIVCHHIDNHVIDQQIRSSYYEIARGVQTKFNEVNELSSTQL